MQNSAQTNRLTTIPYPALNTVSRQNGLSAAAALSLNEIGGGVYIVHSNRCWRGKKSVYNLLQVFLRAHSGCSISYSVHEVTSTCTKHVKIGSSSRWSVFVYSSSPEGAHKSQHAVHAAASQRHAGAAEVFGQGLESKSKNPSTVFKKQSPDRWKLNHKRNALRKNLPLRLRNPTFEAAETFAGRGVARMV